MSYDLYFYKQKKSTVSKTDIAKYLTENLGQNSESDIQWFFENEDTEVYYSIELNEPDEEEIDDEELYETFDEFDNTFFLFNLNFMRPSFFGLEAFEFVEKFCNDLELFILNPQSEFDNPYKPNKQELFDNWNKTNISACKENFDENECYYYPLEKSNKIWQYNFSRQKLQEEIGKDYFVSRIFFCRQLSDNKIVTLSTWTQHIPNVFPIADYYLLTREYKKLFRTVKDTVLISHQTFIENFASYLEDYKVEGCKIIHSDKASKAKDVFNGLKSDLIFGEFIERIGIENLWNTKP